MAEEGEARIARSPVKRGVQSSRSWVSALESSTQATRDAERTLPRFVADWAQKYTDLSH